MLQRANSTLSQTFELVYPMIRGWQRFAVVRRAGPDFLRFLREGARLGPCPHLDHKAAMAACRFGIHRIPAASPSQSLCCKGSLRISA